VRSSRWWSSRWRSSPGLAAATRPTPAACAASAPSEQSSTETARAARADIRRRVADGQSDADIRQAYIDKFGDSILLKPEGGGLGILVWGLPAAVLVLGGGGLVLALRRWRREPHLHPTDADRELVGRARP
jgi:cytochrome c-type biogenesis protein CcmH/NrfF